MSKKLSKEEILNRIKRKNLLFISGDLSKRLNIIEVKCLNCGNIYRVRLFQILRGHGGCKKCGKFRIVSEEEIRKRLHEFDLELLSSYKNMSSIIKVKCLKCGYEYEKRASYILIKKRKCPECIRKNKIKKQMLTIDEIVNRLNEKNLILLSNYKGVKEKVLVKCKKCGNEYEITPDSIFSSINGCKVCSLKDPIWEGEIYELFKSKYNLNVIRNYKFYGNFEVDIYFPDYKIGLELNGLYWHSFSPYIKNGFQNENQCKWHLYNKKILGLKNNINIIFLFEHEYHNRQFFNKFLDFFLTKFGIYDKKIYARKCVFKEVNQSLAFEFYKENHLLDNPSPGKHFGLFFDDELVSLMSFKRIKDDWMLTRYCSKRKYQVIGGFKKLLLNIIRFLNIKTNIYTFIDLRFVDPKHNVFVRNSFKKVGEVEPRYFYWKNSPKNPKEFKILDRIYAQKKHLRKILPKFNENLTENENVFKYFFGKCYDCGKVKLVFEIKNTS